MKVLPQFNNIDEIKNLFPKDFLVIGVGVTAFPRSALAYLLPNYKILCLLETKDLGAIRKVCPVVSLEKDLKVKLPDKFNTSEMLQLPPAKKFLTEKRGTKESGLFLYKASTISNRLTAAMGLKVLSTPGAIRMVFENKKEFRLEAIKAGLKIIPGETLLVDDLTENKWQEFKGNLGEKLVFQLPDYTVGGGLGTFFINQKQDFLDFKDFIKRRRLVREINVVNVTKFIDGEPSSITGCATRFGVVTGVLQKQIIDQPELVALQGRSGVWLGHDWHVGFSDKAQAEAEEWCQHWGEYMYKKGYRGIYGLDVVVDKEERVWPVECNSRYTGAFPVYTMMQLAQGEVPLDVWHLLEWMDIDYQIDIDQIQKLSRMSKKGAQLLLHNVDRRFVVVTEEVRAGVYKMSNLRSPKIKLEWVRDGFSILDIKNENELVLCDKVVGQHTVLKPAERLGRLLFKRQVVDKKGRLLSEIKQIVKTIYGQFGLMPVEKPEGY